MYTYIHIHTHIHIHIHTSYMDTVMDPYEHILSLILTSSCQTTIISGSFEIMNCVGPFLDYIDCTNMSVVVRVVHPRDVNLHTSTYTYTVTHPSEFVFVFIFEIETHIFTSFVRIHIRIRQSHFELFRRTLERFVHPWFGGGLYVRRL